MNGSNWAIGVRWVSLRPVTADTVKAWDLRRTCLLSFSRQPCSLMRDPGERSTTVRHRSMCFTDFSFVKAHSWERQGEVHTSHHRSHVGNSTQDPGVTQGQSGAPS